MTYWKILYNNMAIHIFSNWMRKKTFLCLNIHNSVELYFRSTNWTNVNVKSEVLNKYQANFFLFVFYCPGTTIQYMYVKYEVFGY